MTGKRFVFLAQRPAPKGQKARFEYRVWPRRPHPAVSLLQSSWPLAGAERRSDIYLVSPLSDRVLVKLRAGSRLEIKRRGEDSGRLQRWTMELSRPFPLSAEDCDRLDDALCLTRRLAPDTALSASHLMAELGMHADHVVPRTVRKSRLLFHAAGCQAEICRVGIDGWTLLTVGLEGTDRAAISAAARRLRLDSLPNRSYGEALLRVVKPQPDRRRLPAGIGVKQRRSE